MAVASGSSPALEEISPEDLKFDLRNPRFVVRKFDSEDAVLKYLYQHADVEELVKSICASGYIDFEPLIVLRNGMVVLEGNRRLAAIRVIESEAVRRDLRVGELGAECTGVIPAKIRAFLVDSREEARAYIGFKHINGPFKWDAIAKAQYAAEWFRDGMDIASISRELGDNHNTVRRLVDGWLVLEQAKAEGFDLESSSKKTFAFSHLYTALARPSVRDFLGIESDAAISEPNARPVPSENRDALLEFMSWLYGQEQNHEPALIQSQNPHLNQLVRVLASAEATIVLRTTRDLSAAFERVEPLTQRFVEALVKTVSLSAEALKMVGAYRGDQANLKFGEEIESNVRSLLIVMRSVSASSDRGGS